MLKLTEDKQELIDLTEYKAQLKEANNTETIVISMEITREEWDKKCNRCGYCCRVYNDSDPQNFKWEGKYCEHLHFDKQHKAFCDIYKNCYGSQTQDTSEKWFCVPIEYVYKRSPECPYNKILKKDVFVARFNGDKRLT